MTKKKHKRKNKTQKSLSKSQIQKGILEILHKSRKKSYNIRQLAYQLGMVQKKERNRLEKILLEMVADGLIIEQQPWKYRMKLAERECISGIIEITRFGYAFVQCNESGEEIFIPPGKTGSAFSGDTVKVKISQDARKKKAVGEVTEVIHRQRTTFVGRLELGPRHAFVIPDGQNVHTDFYIPRSRLNNAQDGDKVIVKLTDWPKGSKNPFGHIIKVLGPGGDHETEIHAILEEFGLPYQFPEGILLEADRISDKITPQEIKKRKDFRDVLTFTIDPEDAKDFDDALSFRKLDNNHYEVGIHIADVTHYLKEGSDLDKEAIKRATSVYLVDRVVPMLPEKLSNELCSLRPDEDKLCFSAVFELNKNAEVISEWFGKTIIHSNKRFTYEEVQEIIESGKGLYAEEIAILNQLACKLREKRFANGSFSFETEEVKFHLDEKGVPLGVFTKIRKEAHMLIEDFMLLANRKVAELMSKYQSKYPFVFRVHARPNEEKLNDFRRIASQFGYHIDISSDRALALSLNKLLEDIEGKPEQNFLESLAIRSMSKAKYTTDNIGHYGLAFENYTHFTSPIRRYPDVMVHRILNLYLHQKPPVLDKAQLEAKCNHCSLREINAEMAERASVKFKQVEYLSDKVGEIFEGMISGINDSGFYVELTENKCEGFVPFSSLTDDFYIVDRENYQAKGYNTQKLFKLGQMVKVKVEEADILKRRIEFSIA